MTSWGLLPNWFLLKPPCLIHLIWFCMPCSIACIIFAVIITLPPGNRNAMITVCVYSHVSGLPSCLSVSHANLKTLWSESWLQNKCQRHDPSITLLKTNDPAEVRDLMWGESCLMTPHHTVWEAAQSKAPQEVPQLWKQPQSQLKVKHETRIWRKSGFACSSAPGTTCHLTAIHHKQLPWLGNYFYDTSVCLGLAEPAERTEPFSRP